MSITISPAALEAGARRIYETWRDRDSTQLLPPWEWLVAQYRQTWLDQARAAFLAMIENWEGMSLHQQDINAQYSYFVLPLTEASEVYAGSEGFIPETCAEGYQRQIITQMVDCISAALGEERT